MSGNDSINGIGTLADPLSAIEYAINTQKSNKIGQYYPDNGPLRRELYPKHCAVFEAGKEYRTRAVISGNRCITPWTPIEMGHATRLCGEILSEPSINVRSWDGDSRCTKQASGVFLTGIEPAFHLVLDNGQYFQCSRKHRVLTREGWLSLAQLMSRANGLRCRRTNSNWKASYGTGNRLCDPLLQPVSDSGQSRLPLLAGAPVLSHYLHRLVGEVERTQKYKHAYQEFGPLSIQDVQQPLVDLCAQFSNPLPYIDALWPIHLLRELQLFANELGQSQRERLSSDRPDLRPEPWLSYQTSNHARRSNSEENLESLQEFGHYGVDYAPLQSCEEFLYDALDTEIVVPFSHPPLIGGSRIIAVVPIGFQPILDFEVEGTHCYESGGLISHNTGKSEGIGVYETVLHLTGRYPPWWKGHRFKSAIKSWVAGDTGKTVKEILQEKFLGPFGSFGTGMLPKDSIVRWTSKAGLADAVDTIYVRHITGGLSMLVLKSYDQKREAFQGSEQHWIMLDEEPPEDIMTECAMRTMETGGFAGGKILLTFTPVNGWTDVVDEFLNTKKRTESHRYLMTITWDDAPHLSEKAKAELLAEIPEYQRQARIYGVPELGSGAIYPFEDDVITCDPFPIPDHWSRIIGLDVGNKTAAVWIAHDRDTDKMYLYSEYYREGAEPSVHASAIKAISGGTGIWIPIYCDPAANQSSQIDGRKILQLFKNEGLDVRKADNTVEAGIMVTYSRFNTGRLKVFKSCPHFLEQRRRYKRKDGKIVKDFDHNLDAQRYALMANPNNYVAKVAQVRKAKKESWSVLAGGRAGANGWMAS